MEHGLDWLIREGEEDICVLAISGVYDHRLTPQIGSATHRVRKRHTAVVSMMTHPNMWNLTSLSDHCEKVGLQVYSIFNYKIWRYYLLG